MEEEYKKEHDLKIWPIYFESVWNNQKLFEVRKNDRDFQVGDMLLLREFDPESQKYTGNQCYRRITYILHGGAFGIEEGYCVIGINHH